MVDKVKSIPKHDEGKLIEKINSMSEEEKKETAKQIAEILLEDAKNPILDDSIRNLTQTFNIALLAGLNEKERTVMVSHKLAVAMSKVTSLQSHLSVDIDIFGDKFTEKTVENISSRLKYLNFSELSIYVRQREGLFLRKTIYVDGEPDIEIQKEEELGLNMQNILSNNWERTGFNFKISQTPVEGVGEDFAIEINDDIFIAGDDYEEAREISHSIELFEIVGVVFENAITKQQGERDPLTSLLNRRTFEQHIEGKNGFYMLFDIDKFKTVNDTHGHDVGDLVIKKVAEIIESSVKTDRDVVCRWGGEEIAVFLSTERTRLTPKSTAAISAAERIRKNIENYEWSEILPNRIITVSGGISRFSGNLDSSYKLADNKLYEAKEGGRNQIQYHRDEIDDREDLNPTLNRRGGNDRRHPGQERRKDIIEDNNK